MFYDLWVKAVIISHRQFFQSGRQLQLASYFFIIGIK
ncbi:Uncharacterised protein [Mycobacteroides abscessus subsp. abscessus]|nr:Uncharacterised protein [Mycobacteroides abscessus subsp. abscessus]